MTGLGVCTRNVGCKTGSIACELEAKTFSCDRSIRLFADVIDAEEVNSWALTEVFLCGC